MWNLCSCRVEYSGRLPVTSPSPDKVSPDLRQDIDDLEKRTQELTKTTEDIKIGRKKKAMTENKRISKKRQLMECSEKLKELTKERDDTRRELEEKEEELTILQLADNGEQEQIDDESIVSEKKEEIKKLDRDVAIVERQIIKARDDQIVTITERVEELSEQRDQIKAEIEKKEKELKIFHRKACNQMNDENLKAFIKRKEAEVSRLRCHMTEVEEDLSRTQEEHDKFRKQLKQTTVELVENCEHVRALEKSRAELERERSRVDTKLKMEIAKSEVL